MRDPTEHPTHIGKDEPLSLTEIATFGHDAQRCLETGRVFEQGVGSHPRHIQSAKKRFRLMESDGAPPAGWSCRNTRRKFPKIGVLKAIVAVQDGKQVRARTTHELGWVAPSRLSIAGRRHVLSGPLCEHAVDIVG
jgi:hypothetical protein